MRAAFELFDDFFSGLLVVFLPLMAMLGAIWLGTRAHCYFGRKAIGWTVGLASLFILSFMIDGTVERSKRHLCRGDVDFTDCVEHYSDSE